MKTLRCVFIGKSGVGKTSILRIASNDTTRVLPTIGIDNTLFDYKHTFVQVWDTSGADKFKSVSKLFIEKSRLCIYVYDAATPDTYEPENIPMNSIVVANVTQRGSTPIEPTHIPVNIKTKRTINNLLDAMIAHAVIEHNSGRTRNASVECCCCS